MTDNIVFDYLATQYIKQQEAALEVATTKPKQPNAKTGNDEQEFEAPFKLGDMKDNNQQKKKKKECCA
jgi:hypothetical protein